MSHAASAGVSLRARECNHPLEGKKCDQVHQSVMGGVGTLVCAVLAPSGSRLFVPTFLLRLTAHDQSGHMDFNLQPNVRWAIQ